jgi:hypothetical protein
MVGDISIKNWKIAHEKIRVLFSHPLREYGLPVPVMPLQTAAMPNDCLFSVGRMCLK